MNCSGIFAKFVKSYPWLLFPAPPGKRPQRGRSRCRNAVNACLWQHRELWALLVLVRHLLLGWMQRPQKSPRAPRFACPTMGTHARFPISSTPLPSSLEALDPSPRHHLALTPGSQKHTEKASPLPQVLMPLSFSPTTSAWAVCASLAPREWNSE